MGSSQSNGEMFYRHPKSRTFYFNKKSFHRIATTPRPNLSLWSTDTWTLDLIFYQNSNHINVQVPTEENACACTGQKRCMRLLALPLPCGEGLE